MKMASEQALLIEDVDDFLAEAREDYVGLWQIVRRARQ